MSGYFCTVLFKKFKKENSVGCVVQTQWAAMGT